MTDEQVVKQWFLRLLADFRIYSPLYKVTIGRSPIETDCYLIVAEAGGNLIECRVYADNGKVFSFTQPTMTYKGG